MAIEMTSLERRTLGDILARAARGAERKLVGRVGGALSVFFRGVAWTDGTTLHQVGVSLGETVVSEQPTSGDLPGRIRCLVPASSLWPFIRHLRGRDARHYGEPTRLDLGAWREVSTVLGSSMVSSLVSSAGLVAATAPARPLRRAVRPSGEFSGRVLATEFELVRDDQGVAGYLSWHFAGEAAGTLQEGCAAHLAPVAAALESLSGHR